MKRLYFLILAIFITSFLHAQQLEEVVYLNNGNIIRGLIIEQIPNQSLKIKEHNGNIHICKMDEIAKITKEATTYPMGKNETTTLFGKSVNKNYHGTFEIGHALGVGEEGAHKVEIMTSHGIQFNPYLYTGLGLGFSGFYYDGALGFPLYAHLITHFHDTERTSFIDTRLGYSFGDTFGAYFSIAYGYRFKAFKRIRLSALVGYTRECSNGISTKLLMDF